MTWRPLLFTLYNSLSISRKQDFGYIERETKRDSKLATLGATTTWSETTITITIQSKSTIDWSQVLSLATSKSTIERRIKGLKNLAKHSINYGWTFDFR